MIVQMEESRRLVEHDEEKVAVIGLSDGDRAGNPERFDYFRQCVGMPDHENAGGAGCASNVAVACAGTTPGFSPNESARGAAVCCVRRYSVT